ncbi:MAG TPA: PAS domain-containing sensor histidine kinase [Aggregatilinea sp.]|jgi:two-component system phosphate regulon sensor histidine kinase PhoR|uniref:sensor histidine kinase n=1 Tax=Aggregatilinea sp. TaxID=2806333 RepID=UPI002BEAD4D4|nr:PAS domain-containing sensor histidine kinase [Aggregatilinea sp.]HML22619.1 PAS domain-containing sensor histidine kinase [Aggregatilinea sp.]
MSEVIAWVLAVAGLAAAGVAGWKWYHLQQQAAAYASTCASLKLSLTRSEQLRDGLLKVIDDAVLVLDERQSVVLANEKAAELSGSDPMGKLLSETLRHPELEMLSQDARIVGGGEGVERRIEYGHLILNARAVVVQNDDRSLEILTLRDVTEFQRLERARREMVSNISHELSTPITTIGLLADTLYESAVKEKPKRVRKMTADIRREVDTLTQLVQEMRDLALIESGQMPVRLTPCDLMEIVQGTVDQLLPLVENKQQAITVDVPENICVLADDLQIRRALKNIIHNAVKFTPELGQIEVRATTSADEAIIMVKDSGPGIPSEDLPRLFERFFQVDRARSTGTGLGLAIVRHIVLAHGGRTWAESAPGEGATFFVSLALSEG